MGARRTPHPYRGPGHRGGAGPVAGDTRQPRRYMGSLLIGLYGAGLVGAGIFTADPAFGFPPGTPADYHAVSWHGLMHLVSGAIGFCGLIAACMVFARRFAGIGQTGRAAYSVATGVIFFAAF